jgi:hypothetical protein
MNEAILRKSIALIGEPMMKNHSIAPVAILAALAIWAAPAAYAAATCQLSFSDGTVDLGQVSVSRRAVLRSDQNGPKIGSSNRTLSVTCNTSTAMVLGFHAAAAGADAMELGHGGNYTLHILRARLDGQPIRIGRAGNVTQLPTEIADQLQLRASDSIAAVSEQKIASGTRLELDLRIDAFMRKDAVLSHEIQLEGESRFDLTTN